MKNKKTSKGCLGNLVETFLSDPIQKKKHTTEELPRSVDTLNSMPEQQPSKIVRPKKKDPKSKKTHLENDEKK